MASGSRPSECPRCSPAPAAGSASQTSIRTCAGRLPTMIWPTAPTSPGWCERMSADRLTILAVDDERTQLEDLARLLRSFPSVEDVECASDGHAALVMASAERYDAIFLDVRMPDIDGLELGRVLRRFAAPPQLVFVSASDNAAADAFEL